MRLSLSADERGTFAEHKHPMFDWNNLHVFLELARRGRLGPTARRLRIDHTTVSRRVAELERSLDQKLFDRTADGFVLTEAGTRLQPLAEAMEQQALLIATGKTASPAGSVRVASMEGFGSQYVAQYLPSLAALYPELLVELVTSPNLVNLSKREADVSLSFTPPRGPRLQVRQIGSFALFLYAAPAYLAAHGCPAMPEDLVAHRFVDYVEDVVQIPEVLWLHELVSHPRVCFRSSSLQAQAAAAAAGAGLVALPSFAGEADPRLVPVLKRSVRTERPIYLGVHEDLAWIPRVRVVVRVLEEQVAADRGFLMQDM
jgi:DNA-binding transcriptional LysR family regulator